MPKHFDVIIVGAGPAGCIAALNLAKTKLSVAILDKASFPRDKICGDAISGNVTFELNRLETGLLQKLDAFPKKMGTKGIRFFSPNHSFLDIGLPKSNYGIDDPGFIAKRIDFDHLLFDEVYQHPNISVFENSALKALKTNPVEVRITTQDHELTAQLIIGADGAHSMVAKLCGLSEMDPKHHSAGLRIYYENVSGFDTKNLIELHFYKNILPGYLWVFPLPHNQANVGIVMLSKSVSDKKVNLKKLLEDQIQGHPNLKERFKDAKALETPKGFGLPLGSKKRTISANRVMLCGDAASLIDPFTGEGIGNAMTSGRIAALHAVEAFEANTFSKEFMKEYDRKIYAKMGTEFRISHIMQKLLRFPKLFDFVVKKANKNEVVRGLLINMFDSVDIKKQLTKPSFYFKLLFK
jgi:geranylgeranyl reductase family protein